MRKVMIASFWICALSAASFLAGCGSDSETPDQENPVVQKTNPMKVYMHYMPWFQSKEVSGFWGSHWRMNNRNPEIIDGTGKRQIASHYYPLIGPYDSKDPDVIEYHLLLMKYAGVDGVLIDWYGTHNVYDYKVNLVASDALIDKLDETRIEFAIVYEEYTAENVDNQTSLTAMQAAQQDMAYMQNNYFSKEEYIHIEERPLLMTFGPRYFKQGSQWTEIFQSVTPKPNFLPLWGHSSFVGANGNGEYAWVDFNASFRELNNFYNKYFNVLVGSAYPRFHDYYQEGGQGDGYGTVEFNNGETLRQTLALADDRNAKYVQLVTWNDFGEGTVIEPTLEDEFLCLEIIQQFTGVTYGRDELELIHTYYLKKKQYKSDTQKLEKLKEAFEALTNLQVEQARTIIEALD